MWERIHFLCLGGKKKKKQIQVSNSSAVFLYTQWPPPDCIMTRLAHIRGTVLSLIQIHCRRVGWRWCCFFLFFSSKVPPSVIPAALFVYAGFLLSTPCSMFGVFNKIIWIWISAGTGEPWAKRSEENIGSLNFIYLILLIYLNIFLSFCFSNYFTIF